MESGAKMKALLSASGLSLEVHCIVTRYRRKMSSFIFYLITREANATVLLVANFAAHVSDTLQMFDLGL